MKRSVRKISSLMLIISAGMAVVMSRKNTKEHN